MFSPSITAKDTELTCLDVACKSLSVGLGMTVTEWQDLRSRMDDSFWVMRVIGAALCCPPVQIRPL
jgi:hypothetical protein